MFEIDNGTISPPPANQPNVTRNPLPNHNAVPPPRNVNMIENAEKEFDPTNLIVPEGQQVKPYVIPENNEVCIINVVDEIWIEGGEEEQQFEQDITDGIVAIEWWNLMNIADDSIWYEEEREIPTEDDLWKQPEKGESSEIHEHKKASDDLWAVEIGHLTRSGRHFKPHELENDHPGRETEKGKAPVLTEEEEEDKVLK